jgi:ectoine hydroxylase-related dioxygenase (phytanoyl-CoA dioxygenase family)
MSKNIEWVYWPDPKSVTNGMTNLEKFSSLYVQRKEKYPNYSPNESSMKVAQDIDEKGYAKIENFLSLELIDKINEKTQRILDDGNHPYNQNKISQLDAKNTKAYIQVLQPLVSVPEMHEFVFNDFIIDIAGAYLDCFPAFGTCNLRKSFVNSLPEEGTQLYHVDPNSPRFLKFFVYLNDVDMDGGPFCYVEGSHKKKFEIDGVNWNNQYRWGVDAINEIYGEENVKYLTAKKGDLLVADTNGWHRGMKPVSNDRTMLTLDYVCHDEDFDSSRRFHFSKDEYNKLSDKHKQLCDFLKIV